MSNTQREDVIKLAREAGLAEVTDTAESLPADYVDALAKLCALAVAKEREACAKVCEYQADRFMQASPLEGNRPYASHECAAAIRARSNT